MLIEGIALAIVSFLFGRMWTVPRDVRVHDQQIHNRDARLDKWLEDDGMAYRRKSIQIGLDERYDKYGAPYKYLRRVAHQQAKDAVLHRYQDQLMEAQQLIRDVRAEEGALHRAWRRVASKPVPELTAPGKHARMIEVWKTPEATKVTSQEDKLTLALEVMLSSGADAPEGFSSSPTGPFQPRGQG